MISVLVHVGIRSNRDVITLLSSSLIFCFIEVKPWSRDIRSVGLKLESKPAGNLKRCHLAPNLVWLNHRNQIIANISRVKNTHNTLTLTCSVP